MFPADIKSDIVLRLCRGISESDVRLVPLHPLANKPLNECFSIVPEHIEKHGGSQVIGWAVWEWPKVLIEAEFHCVWRNKEGELIDISPKMPELGNISNITFLPDPKAKYDGRQVNNIRRALTDSLLVRRFIDASNQLFVEMNKGDLADYHGPLELSHRGTKLYNSVNSLRQKIAEKTW